MAKEVRHFTTDIPASEENKRTNTQLPLFSVSSPLKRPDEAVTPYTIPVYRVALIRESFVQAPSERVRSARDAEAIVRQHLADVDREHFVVLLLNRKNVVIGVNTVSVGSLTASVVSPREVFKAAILGNAAAIICAHNHPSGDPQPSTEDKVLTARLVQGGELLGIGVLDHIIIGDGTEAYCSFADNNLLGEKRRIS